MKILGNGFWLMDGNRVYCSKLQRIYHLSELPISMQYQFIDKYQDMPTDGTQFMMFDYCEGFYYSKSGKTSYAKFVKFDYISNGWAKVYDKFKEFNYNFIKDRVYLFYMKFNSDYPFNWEIINYENTLEKKSRS